MQRGVISAVVGVLFVLAGLLAGCGSSNNGVGSGSGGLQVYLSDAPIDAKAVNVSISRVDVSKDGVGWATLRSYSPDPLVLNLLDYRYEGAGSIPARFLLADVPLDAGHYTQIRLILTKVELVDNSDVVSNCAMSSEDKTGLKLIGSFDVEAGTKSAVLIDFDAARSIVREGMGTYRLKPTVRCVPIKITANIGGSVVFKDAGGATIDVPAGASIAAYSGPDFVASSPIAADGTFLVPAVFAGSYNLVLEFPADAPVVYSIPVTVVDVAVGTDKVLADPLVASPVP
jgi:hypothetical protein